MVNFISPIREKQKAIENDKDYLPKSLKQGRDKARASAAATIQLVKMQWC